MEYVNCSNELKTSLFKENKPFIIKDNKFIKRATCEENIDSILHIDEKKDLLTKKKFALIDKMYLYKDRVIATERKYYKSYQTLTNSMNNLKVSKDKIILDVFNVLKELENIEIDYWDLHSDNILINNDNIKLIDLGSSFYDKKMQSFLFHYYKIVNLIIQLYVFYDNLNLKTGYLDELLKMDISSYFSKEIYEYLICLKNLDISEIDINKVVSEFNDLEKMNSLRRSLNKY